MTKLVHRHRGKLLGIAAAAALVGLALTGFRDQSAGVVAREITLVSHGIAFHLDGQTGAANPTLRLRRGERVRLTLRNDEPGQVLHCFTIPGLDVRSTRNLETGESEALEFTPRRRGAFAYACMLHPSMTGSAVVE